MRKLTTLIYVCGCALTFSAQAQNQDEATFLVKEKSAEKVGDKLAITMHIDVSGMDIPKSRSVVCTPIIESGDSLRALPQIILNGKTRHILYERMERQTSGQPTEYEYRRFNGEEQQIEYQIYTPYADWMKRSEVSIVLDECGCGWEALQSNKSPLFALRFEPVVLRPALAYVTPQAEAVKARQVAGSAYLDFPVNQTTIQPDYRNNPAELGKIKKGIEAVRNNKFATITAVSIKGYASPEGGYANNARLAEGRAEALLEYVESLYDFGNARMRVDSEPEDWDGLKTYRYVPATGIGAMEEDVMMPVAMNGDISFSIAPGTYTCTVQLTCVGGGWITLTDAHTGVSDVDAEAAARVVAGDGEILIVGDADEVNVYTASGMLIASDVETITCPAGVYIVVIDGRAHKVLVK